jgi:hypothetical protein
MFQERAKQKIAFALRSVKPKKSLGMGFSISTSTLVTSTVGLMLTTLLQQQHLYTYAVPWAQVFIESEVVTYI